jgi:enoyl-CoA hydratase
MLFTSEFVTAEEGYRLGMVNHVVPLADLEAFTLEFAQKIAKKPGFTLKLAKEAVNAAQDSAGRVNAMQTSFALHQLSHAHGRENPISKDRDVLSEWRANMQKAAPQPQPAK